MLDSEQIEGKNKALVKEAEKVEKLTENKKGDVSFKSKSKATDDSSSLGETSPTNIILSNNENVNTNFEKKKAGILAATLGKTN